MIELIKKQLKKIVPSVKTSNEEIKDILMNSVIKRDIFEDERSDEVKKKIKKYESSQQKIK